MNKIVKKSMGLDKFNNNLPDLEIGDIVELGDVWDGKGEVPEDSYSYELDNGSNPAWINYEFDILEKNEDVLRIMVKITAIDLI